MNEQTSFPSATSRRQFLKTSGTAVIGGTLAAHLAFPRSASAADGDLLKVGLVGCGGRGSGAALQALNADKNVVLCSMGDVFESQLQRSLRGLKKQLPDKVRVGPEHCFSGLD